MIAYGDAAFEADNFDEIAGWYETAAPAFETVAKAELSGKGKAVQRTAFESACKALLQGFTCSELCGELGNVAVQNSAKETPLVAPPTKSSLSWSGTNALSWSGQRTIRKSVAIPWRPLLACTLNSLQQPKF